MKEAEYSNIVLCENKYNGNKDFPHTWYLYSIIQSIAVQ